MKRTLGSLMLLLCWGYASLGWAAPGVFLSRFLTDTDTISLHNDHSQTNLLQIFQARKQALLTVLVNQTSDPNAPGSSPFAVLSGDDEGLALVFATVVAYELRGPIQPLVPGLDGSPAYKLDEILNFAYPYTQYGIICDQYVTLTVQLFYRMYPQVTIQLTPFGVGRDSSIDNHAMITAITTLSGLPLFLDPTTSIVAVGSLHDLMINKPLTAVARVSERDDAQRTAGGFGGQLKSMLILGTLDYRSLTYNYIAQPSKFSYDSHDYVRTTIAANVGGHAEFWYIKDQDASTWIIRPTPFGVVQVNFGATTSVVPVAHATCQPVDNVWRIMGKQRLMDPAVNRCGFDRGYEACKAAAVRSWTTLL